MLSKLRTKTLLLPLLLLIAASITILASSWDSTAGRFYLDSEGHFRAIPYFREPSLSWQKIHGAIFLNPYPAAQRPIPTFSFLIENNLLGLTPKSGRIINVLIHCFNIFILFFLCRRILIHFGKEQTAANSAALLGALLWGLNPFHADTVYYVIQRMTTLSAMFYLLGVLAYLRTRESPGNWGWWGALAASFAGGLACKENAALLPLGLLVLEFALPPDGIGGPQAQRKRLGWLLAAVIVLPLSGALALGYSPGGIIQSLLEKSPGREFTSLERLMTEGRVLMHYLSLLFFPHPDRLAFVLKYPLSQSLFNPITTIVSWGTIAALLAVASFYKRLYPLVWLGIFWFFTNHLLESTVIPLEIAFVHRNYLPSVFLFLPIAVWLVSHKRRQLTLIATSILLILILPIGWNARASIWGDPTRFWEDSVEKSPGSLRAYINLGVMWDIQGQPAKGLEIYQMGITNAYDENPAAWSSVYCNMGIASMNLGHYGPADSYMTNALSLAPLPDCLINMAKLQLRVGNPGRAMQAMEKLFSIRPRHRKLHLMRAKIYLTTGQLEVARIELKQELALFPGNIEAKNLLHHLDAR